MCSNMLITSTDNKKVKDIVKLRDKKYRDVFGKFLVETENLVKEAYIDNRLEEIYLLEGSVLSFEVDIPIYYVTDKVMNKIKGVRTSKVVGVVKQFNSNEYIGNKYLMLDRISDPGNLGTIIRSSVAFGIDTIIVSNDSCDIYNDKVIRATEGAIFKINIIREDLLVAINNLNKFNIPIYGTDVVNGVSVSSVKSNSFCVIMGNEGCGISNRIRELVSKNIYIKTRGVESLNVAVATSIILYELSK